METIKKPILLVEDDNVDAKAVFHALKQMDVECEIIWLNQSTSVMDKLNEMTDAELPFLILLDLNMPILTGFDLLKLFKKDENLKEIPVVVVSTSQDSDDIKLSKNLGADDYLVKHLDLHQFTQEFKIIKKYFKNDYSLK